MTSPRNDDAVQLRWMGVLGEWQSENGTLRFLGKARSSAAGPDSLVIGIAASNIERFTEGEIEATVQFADTTKPGHTAGVILGFKSLSEQFFYVEFGDTCGFSVSTYVPGLFRPLIRNESSQLASELPCTIKAYLRGRFAELCVNGVRVAEAVLPDQPAGHQVALIASGITPVSFENIRVTVAKPRAFVATQFTAPFDRIWDKVIRKAAEDEGFNPIRIDEVAGPNPILADIKRHVVEAAVLIAEITPLNANVFYEVGYADALKKPLILLAQAGTKLPFDIQGYRTVFYDDVIGGELKLSENLRKQLRVIL
ncbi:MAG: hypothetical protein AAB403_00445 [Planctomycetota bacterium]